MSLTDLFNKTYEDTLPYVVMNREGADVAVKDAVKLINQTGDFDVKLMGAVSLHGKHGSTIGIRFDFYSEAHKINQFVDITRSDINSAFSKVTYSVPDPAQHLASTIVEKAAKLIALEKNRRDFDNRLSL
jgi:hypothetical protein